MSFILQKNDSGTITTIKNETNSHLNPHLSQKQCSTHELKTVKSISFYERQSYMMETLVFVCNVLCLLLTAIYSEIPSIVEDQDELDFLNEFIMLLSISSSIFSFFSYYSQFRGQLIIRKQLTIPSTLIFLTVSVSKSFFLLIHPNRMFEDQTNSFLSAICYFKIIPVYLYFSKLNLYYGSRPARVLAFYGQKHKLTNIKYSIKCIFKTKGLLLNLFLLFFATIVLSVVSISVCSDQSFITQVYKSMVSMTTVGYGQVTPQTSLNRLIIIIIIIVGSIASTILTITFLQSLTLQDQQQKAYKLINRIQVKQQKKQEKLQKLKNFINRKSIRKEKEKRCMRKGEDLNQSISIENYLDVRKKLRILIEKQILTNELLTFFMETRAKEKNESTFGSERSRKRGQRVEDNNRIYTIKKNIFMN